MSKGLPLCITMLLAGALIIWVVLYFTIGPLLTIPIGIVIGLFWGIFCGKILIQRGKDND